MEYYFDRIHNLRVGVETIAQPGSSIVGLEVGNYALIKRLVLRCKVLRQELNAQVVSRRSNLYCSKVGTNIIRY